MEEIRYRGRLITDMTRDELLDALRDIAAYDMATRAMHREHMDMERTLLGLPVVEVDDLPDIRGVRFGKPLL